MNQNTGESEGPTDFDVLRIKRALTELGLDVSESTPRQVVELYERVHSILVTDEASGTGAIKNGSSGSVGDDRPADRS